MMYIFGLRNFVIWNLNYIKSVRHWFFTKTFQKFQTCCPQDSPFSFWNSKITWNIRIRVAQLDLDKNNNTRTFLDGYYIYFTMLNSPISTNYFVTVTFEKLTSRILTELPSQQRNTSFWILTTKNVLNTVYGKKNYLWQITKKAPKALPNLESHTR